MFRPFFTVKKDHKVEEDYTITDTDVTTQLYLNEEKAKDMVETLPRGTNVDYTEDGGETCKVSYLEYFEDLCPVTICLLLCI